MNDAYSGICQQCGMTLGFCAHTNGTAVPMPSIQIIQPPPTVDIGAALMALAASINRLTDQIQRQMDFLDGPRDVVQTGTNYPPPPAGEYTSAREQGFGREAPYTSMSGFKNVPERQSPAPLSPGPSDAAKS